MEKYSKWRDAGTGIQPFLQVVPPVSSKNVPELITGLLKNYIFAPVVVAIRVILVTVIVVIDGSTQFICNLIPMQKARNETKSTFRKLCARAALFSIGFYSIEEQERKIVNREQGERESSLRMERWKPKSGDIIMSNHCSYVDVLYFIAKFDPTFIKIDNATLHVQPLRGWDAIMALGSARPPALLNAKDAIELCNLTRDNRLYGLGPIVVFGENATTNGEGLLQPLPILSSISINMDEETRLGIYGLKYMYKRFSPTYTNGSRVRHFLRLLGQVYNTLVVRFVDPQDCPQPYDYSISESNSGEKQTKSRGKSKGAKGKGKEGGKGKGKGKGKGQSAGIESEEDENVNIADNANDNSGIDQEISNIISTITRTRQTRLTAVDKLDFLKYYESKN